MAQKGVNTLIRETKMHITDAVNEGLKAGLPIGVIATILDSVALEVSYTLEKVIEGESAQYKQETDAEASQIPYVEPEVVDPVAQG